MPIIIIALLFLLVGCTTEDGEVITPPSRYAFPFKGKVTLVWLDTVAIHNRCGPTAVSCAPIGPVTECTIWINKEFKKYSGWRKSILIHEQAHCNGWPADHPK